jgi:hypothetical protein
MAVVVGVTVVVVAAAGLVPDLVVVVAMGNCRGHQQAQDVGRWSRLNRPQH